MSVDLQAASASEAVVAGGNCPLAGVRVVDMTNSYAGPTAAMYLADLGASVVKVERPAGDDARSWGPPFADGVSAWFASANRNKRSVVLDVRTQEGHDVLMRLLDDADVFLHNVNPAKVKRIGIDADTLRGRNPRLIYCAVSGFGLGGPDCDLPGYDLVAQARSGLMSVTGAEGGSPQRVSTALSDIVAGMCATIAINAALVRQQASGKGDVIDISLLDADLALMAPRLAAYLAGGPEPAPSGGTDSVLALYQSFDAADRSLVIAVGNDAMWRRLCAALDLPDLATDAALTDNAGRRRHSARITTMVSERLRTRPASHWLRVLERARVPAALVQRLSEVVNDPHVVARGSLVPVPGSEGQLVSVRSPFRLASTPQRNERFPELGEHTSEVLAELGYTADEVRRLTTGGTPTPTGQETVR